MKALKGLVVLLVIAFAVVVLGKNMIAKTAVIGGTKMITGLDARIDSMQVGLFSTAVGIKGLKVMNPSKFSEKVMLDMPEIYIDYKLGDLFKGKAHLETIRINMKEFNVVKASDGVVNLDSIQALQQGPQQKGAQEKPKAPAGPAPELQIDLLELQVGKVFFIDDTKNPPSRQEFNVGINERYQNIGNPYAFAGLVVSRALFKTSVGRLANFDVKGLESGVKQALSASAGQLLEGVVQGSDVAQQAVGVANKLTGKAGKEAAGVATDAVKDATGAMKKLLGN